ncbi:retrotransposon protein, putative, ty1-copia subclass, partial [Tanacetum coccineum]
TSEILMEVEGLEPPQEEVFPILRSARTHRALDRLCLNVKVEEHSLGDLNEPNNYKAAILDPKSDKWVDAMNAEMQFMKDNQDSHSIMAFYDYEIWQMDVKNVFLNGGLNEVIYMVQPKGFVDPNHPRKASGSNVTFLILYVEDIIIMGNHIPSLQSVKSYLGKCFAMKDLGEAAFILGIKIYRDRSKRLIGLSASTSGEVRRMQNVAYALAVGSIMYASAMKTILKYLRNTKDMLLVYGGIPKAELRVDCYCNAVFETDKDDIKSQTGYVFVLNGGAMDWKSSK